MSTEETRALLRSHGFRSTRGRVDLMESLKLARRPLTHRQIVQRLNGKPYNRVSIYRALDALVAAGLIHVAFLSGRKRAFETADRCEARRCHPHFTCKACGKVRCLMGTSVPFVRGLPRGYVVERQKVHLDGLCAGCATSPRRNVKKGLRGEHPC